MGHNWDWQQCHLKIQVLKVGCERATDANWIFSAHKAMTTYHKQFSHILMGGDSIAPPICLTLMVGN